MSGLASVAFFGLTVPAGDEPTVFESQLPGVSMVRITMAAIDPTAKPLEADQPNLATLKIIRRPLDHDDYEDESDEDSEEDENEDESADEEEQEKIQEKSKKLAKKEADKAIKKALKVAEANAMEVDAANKEGSGDDSDDDDDEDEDFGFETEEFVLCTLDPAKQYQQTLDFIVGEDEEVMFIVKGNYDVSLSGNYVVPLSSLNDNEGSDSDEEDSDYDEVSDDEDELMDIINGADESEDELDDVEQPRITEVESDEEEEEKKPEPKKLTKAEKKSLKRAAEEEAKPEEPKLSKKQQKKLKANDGKAVEAGAETPESKKKDTKKPAEKASTTKVVNGVTIEDKKVGTGAVAKNGSKLDMRYIGKLKNGKVFDSNTKGKPFSFRLGKGEVIKGWDIGLVGMQVGGERRITIPSNLAYGSKGVAGIPPNSELIFDVKLLNVK